jgi:large subunit ribosomal protein L30
MLDKVKFSVAFGSINTESLSALIKTRGKKIDGKKFNPDDIAMEIINGKKLDELGFKPFFRLHPPRGGIDSKIQYPKGVLGNNKEDINKLVMRML